MRVFRPACWAETTTFYNRCLTGTKTALKSLPTFRRRACRLQWRTCTACDTPAAYGAIYAQTVGVSVGIQQLMQWYSALVCCVSHAQCSNRFAVLDGVNFICKVSSKGQCMYAFVKMLKTMAATLRQLLDNRNSWSQTIKLELFVNQKSIFGDSFPAQAVRKQDFCIVSGATTPVPLYEFELRELFVVKRR